MFARIATEQGKGSSASNRPDPDTVLFQYTAAEEARIAWKLAVKTLALTNSTSAKVAPRESFYTKYGKRALDIVVSAAALAVTLPFSLVLAICTFLDVGAPILFSQKKIGLNGRPFVLVKFRNMKNLFDEDGALLPPSERVTRFGRFVRRLSLDELLNFWSILKGDMSVIGPRPMELDYFQRFSRRHNHRHLVRPGLGCPFLPPLSHPADWNEQLENDIWYVENISLLTDIKLFIALVGMVFDAKRSKQRDGANRGSFIGYDMSGKAVGTQALNRLHLD